MILVALSDALQPKPRARSRTGGCGKGSAGSAGGTRSRAPAWGVFLDVPGDPVVVVCSVTATSIMQEEERRQRRREKERNSQKAGEAWERQKAQLNRERIPTPMPRPVATQRQDGSITLNLRRDQQGDGGWVRGLFFLNFIFFCCFVLFPCLIPETLLCRDLTDRALWPHSARTAASPSICGGTSRGAWWVLRDVFVGFLSTCFVVFVPSMTCNLVFHQVSSSC